MQFTDINYVIADDAISLINSNDSVFIQGGVSVPTVLGHALARQGDRLKDVTIYTGYIASPEVAPYCKGEYKDSFLVNAFFVSEATEKWINDGYGTVIPSFIGKVPEMFRDGTCKVDVALINCSEPNEDGYVSYGASAGISVAAVESARIVIAQINSKVPFVNGDGIIHVSRLAACVKVDEQLTQMPHAEISNDITRLAKNVASIVPNGATLYFGIDNAICSAILNELKWHKNLGLHTEVLTDEMVELIESGVINNSKKVVEPGKTIASTAIGSEKLYQYLNNNSDILIKDIAWVNEPKRIGTNDNVVSINTCFEMDLTGQICSDSIGEKLYAGAGGHHDFVYGASRSKGGISAVVTLSHNMLGESVIRPILSTGSGVTITRFQVNYVITENGIADLRGKTVAERAKLLIDIAAPEHREALDIAATQRFGHSYTKLKEVKLETKDLVEVLI
jgi:acyl-CoA hydrolase